MIGRKIKEYIEHNRLFDKSDKLLVALSGGADSVALLHLLIELGYICEAAHCNFQLRGEESERDMQFVIDLCNILHIPLHLKRFETTYHAQSKHISIEMAARELRYEWFEKVRTESSARYIAVAHHKDDQAETVLLNLIRGTGISGLIGMRPINGTIVRPFLAVSRAEIISYLDHRKFNYITDSTNLVDDYTRNKLRLNIIPLLADINPSVIDTIYKNSQNLHEAFLLYQKGIADGKKRVMTTSGISIQALSKEVSPQALLHEILSPKGFNPSQIHEILIGIDGQPGKTFIGQDGWILVKDREELILTKKREDDTPPFTLFTKHIKMNKDFEITKNKNIAYIDSDKLKGTPYLRKWKQGDYFVPFGMKGRKLLSNYMTDRKFSLVQKENQWVLCSEENIIWMVGERLDNRYCIDENTTNVSIFSINQPII